MNEWINKWQRLLLQEDPGKGAASQPEKTEASVTHKKSLTGLKEGNIATAAAAALAAAAVKAKVRHGSSTLNFCGENNNRGIWLFVQPDSPFNWVFEFAVKCKEFTKDKMITDERVERVQSREAKKVEQNSRKKTAERILEQTSSLIPIGS